MTSLRRLFTLAVAASTALAVLVPVVPAYAAPHGAGSLVKDPNGPAVFFLPGDGTRRGFTSAGALESYGFLSFSQVVTANAEDMALPQGPLVPPRDGGIFCATANDGTDVAGECALITGGQKAAFTSEAVFKGLGFSFARAKYGSSAFLSKTTNISNTTDAHRAGVLVQNGTTVQMVGTNGLLGFPSPEVFQSWGYSFADVVPSNAADRTMTQNGVVAMRVAGQLNPTALTVTPPPSTGSSVNVTSGSMPTGMTLPQGANNVKVAEFNFTAPSNGSITISSLTVHRSGVGSTSDISNAYIYDGANRLSSGRTFNSSTNDATFALNVQVPANQTKTLALYVNVATSVNAGATHAFSLESASAVNATGATVTGSFPVRSNNFTLTATSQSTLTLALI